ncbi:hypothetical protein BKA70DRAFT_1242530 [Coprinopsis sp. MPI-PUGE-AT-0042]|nr:hypothetical protein BKA70DRAFT_1242530 [Coprinopsis sp. MPI-PUGE-AT-0042]
MTGKPAGFRVGYCPGAGTVHLATDDILSAVSVTSNAVKINRKICAPTVDSNKQINEGSNVHLVTYWHTVDTIMLSLLGPTFRLIAYCFSGILNLFQRPSQSTEDVEGSDHELDRISYQRPLSDPNISSLSDVYFTGLSRSIQNNHVNVPTASTRRCLLIGAKCTHHFAVSVGVYPGVHTRHCCMVKELILYQYVEKPSSKFDLFYKTDESAFHLVRSLDTVQRIAENGLLKIYFPEVLHGSGSSIFLRVREQ